MTRPDDIVLRTRDLAPAGTRYGVDLNLARGQTLAVTGPDTNLSSAWLRMLGAVDPAATGTLELTDTRPWQLSEEELRDLRRRVGFVTRRAPLLSVLDGLANVSLPLLYHGLAERDEAQHRARQVLEELGWAGPLTELPAYLEEGQRRLLAFARAVILDPEILMVDEPFPDHGGRQLSETENAMTRVLEHPRLTVAFATSHAAFARRHADAILFVGPEERPRVFAGWSEMANSADDSVRSFLEELTRRARALTDHD